MSFDTISSLPIVNHCTYTREFDPKISQAIDNGDKTLAATRLEILNAQHNNLGGSTFYFPNGKKYIYRSSMLTGNIPCLKSLVQIHGVRYIIYIKNDSIKHRFNFTEPEHIREKRYFDELVLNKEKSKYIIVDFVNRKYESAKEKMINIDNVSNIIKLIAGLDAPVLIHCMRGEHKTGIVYGIMQKCINKTPIDLIVNEYKIRTGYKNKKILGGSRQEDIDFIKQFPCI